MKLCLAFISHRKITRAALATIALTVGYSAGAAFAAAAPATASTTQPGASVPSVTVPVPAVSGVKAPASPQPATGQHKAATTQSDTAPAKSATTTGATTPVTGSVGSISSHNVNVRSGPGLAYYVLGQLKQGDTVQVLGSQHGWDAIAPPSGTLCYIAKKFVHVGSDSAKGRVSANYVYVRAASKLAPHSDFAVVKVASRGTRVHIVGNTASFYVIEPPSGAHVYVLGKFVTAAGADAQYITPRLQMPPGFKGSTLAATLAAGTSAAISSISTTQPATTSTNSSTTGTVPIPGQVTANTANNGGQAGTAVLPVPPMGKTSKSAQVTIFTKFSALNKQTQLEFQKPLIQRHLHHLLQGYQQLEGMADAPNWVKQGVAARISVLKRAIAIQQLLQASQSTPPVSKVVAPYQQQWRQSQKEVAQALDHAPFVAKGVLRTSTALKSKYALVDPATGRVTAYIDPTSHIDISRLLGEYIGIKGVVTGGGEVVKVINVVSATLLPNPKIRQAAAGQGNNAP